MNIKILQYCNLELKDMNGYIKNNNELIFEFLSKNPHTVYTPKIIAQTLNIKYDTVESALCRFVLMGKVQKFSRGKYVLNPLPAGQSTLDRMTLEAPQ